MNLLLDQNLWKSDRKDFKLLSISPKKKDNVMKISQEYQG